MNTFIRSVVMVPGLVLATLLPAKAETVAIVGAKAYAMTSAAPIEDATIVVRDGKIVAIGPRLTPPANARVIQAQGHIVTPGLMNAGAQLGLTEVIGEKSATDQSVATGPLGAAFDVEYAANPNSILLPIVRAGGLTRAVSYPGGSANPPFAGTGIVVRLVDGPDIIDRRQAGVFVIIGGNAAAKVGGSRSAAWVLLRNALDEAKASTRPDHSAAPGDQLLNHLDIQALQPVIQGREPLVIMTNRESDIRQAVSVGDDYGIRVILMGAAEAWRVAPLLAAHKIPVVINPFDDLPATFDVIGARSDNAAILNRAGVLIAFSVPGGGRLSTDAGAVVREAAGVAVSYGLPWMEGLKAISVNPAAMWGLADHYGTLAPGQDADLVIWDGDPLETTSAPTLVMVRGSTVSLVTRQSLLRDRYSPLRKDAISPAYP